jgi:hypothetical protein
MFAAKPKSGDPLTNKKLTRVLAPGKPSLTLVVKARILGGLLTNVGL